MSTESSHWYTRDGKPCHEQPTKRGAKNPTRPTEVKDAIRLGLLPSVSAITGMLANPGLDFHKMKQVAGAAYDCPPAPGETKEEYQKHIVYASKSGLRKAGDFGTATHAALEAYYGQNKPIPDTTIALPLTGKMVPLKTILDPVIEKVRELNFKIEASERVLVSRLGYAGTTDLQGHKGRAKVTLDFKSKGTREDEPIWLPYTYTMQISGYGNCPAPDPIVEQIGYNVVFSSTEPGRTEVFAYDHQELDRAFEAFKHCLELWKIINKHRTEF